MKRVLLVCMLSMSLGGMAMGDNLALTAAKRAKKDEFYTQRVDIENELRHYKAHFKDKVVLCNCDDPRQSEFPIYDNYDAINVNKTADIPYDYDGVMGVPITFMDKYNPEQFEIVGLDRYVEDNPKYGHRFTLNGRETYARILIRRLKRRAPHTNGTANGIIQGESK